MKRRFVLLTMGVIGSTPFGLVAQEVGRLAADTALEQQLFQANLQEPVALLSDLYKEKKALIISSPSHNADYFQVLLPLLERIGTDPALKYITAERDYVMGPTLEKLSVTPVREADLVERLTIGERITFCLGQESTADLTRLIPLVQRLNARRPASNQVLYTAIDGGQIFWHQSALGREEGTTVEFTKLWKRLGQSGKVIVVYNNAHIVKRISGENWLDRFLERYPEARAQLAIVELSQKTPPPPLQPEHPQGIRLAALERLPEWKAYAEQHRYDAIVWTPPTPYEDEGRGFWTAVGDDEVRAVDSIKPLVKLPILCSAASMRKMAQVWTDSAKARSARVNAKQAAEKKPTMP